MNWYISAWVVFFIGLWSLFTSAFVWRRALTARKTAIVLHAKNVKKYESAEKTLADAQIAVSERRRLYSLETRLSNVMASKGRLHDDGLYWVKVGDLLDAWDSADVVQKPDEFADDAENESDGPEDSVRVHETNVTPEGGDSNAHNE